MLEEHFLWNVKQSKRSEYRREHELETKLNPPTKNVLDTAMDCDGLCGPWWVCWEHRQTNKKTQSSWCSEIAGFNFNCYAQKQDNTFKYPVYGTHEQEHLCHIHWNFVPHSPWVQQLRRANPLTSSHQVQIPWDPSNYRLRPCHDFGFEDFLSSKIWQCVKTNSTPFLFTSK